MIYLQPGQKLLSQLLWHDILKICQDHLNLHQKALLLEAFAAHLVDDRKVSNLSRFTPLQNYKVERDWELIVASYDYAMTAFSMMLVTLEPQRKPTRYVYRPVVYTRYPPVYTRCLQQ